MVSVSEATTKNVLVLGATGNTGKHVVRQLLDSNNDENRNDVTYSIQVIVRSKQRFLHILSETTSTTVNDNSTNNNNLSIIEGSILEVSDNELDTYVSSADTIVICLGHVLSFSGIFGPPYRLVHDSTKRITDSIQRLAIGKKQVILMNSDGVVGPNDTKLSWLERFLFSIIRFLPPHYDNELAADFLYKTIGTFTKNIEWTIVRPCNLLDYNETSTTTDDVNNNKTSNDNDYVVLNNPPGTTILFEYRTVYRSTVAKFMVHLLQHQSLLWNQWIFKFPYIENKIQHVDKNSIQNKKENEL